MKEKLRRIVVIGCALLAGAGPALAQESLAARVQKAQAAAKANAASPEGRAWMQRHSAAVDALLIPVLNGCLPQPEGDIPTAFSVFVRLSPKGGVHEVVTELDAALGKCMTAAARAKTFPAAPREDYWIQVNMAADL
ncbi:MAG TPA: hypothetical protein VGB87_03310 [Vicinamibacteria bacterium]